ncbi:unnamed protein product [Nezara viridula]|uniref:SANT domain-containing protein n=1 Tax=Nezara viridula TaxID=85310 RepID=A0A9P0H656_NEZVI|nr:unnamed protein product [Nezara viridula]
MRLAMSAHERRSIPCNKEVFRNSNFINGNSHFIDLFRRHQRPKISPLLPNPVYLPALYQNNSYNCYGNQNVIPPKLHQPIEEVIDNQFYQRKEQVVSLSQIIENKSSTSPPCQAFCNFDSHSTKTKLLQSITNVDSKITEIEFEIEERKKFEAAKKKPSVKQLKQVLQPINHSLFHNIITENQQKAHEAHSIMLHLGPQLDFPMYNQPCDTAVYHENKKCFILFKEKLKILLRRKYVAKVKTQKSLLRLYSHLACKWKNNINKVENSRRHKSKEMKNRNYFETVFPELQKKKFTRERSKRTGDHVLSEADYQEVLRKLNFENLGHSWIKSSSALLPVLLDSEQRAKFFHNQNNLVTDVKVTGEKEFLNLWTPTEKVIFKEKFIQFSKNFGRIASFIVKKSVADCVKYYYLTKRRENYKISGKSKKMQRMFQQFCIDNEKHQQLPSSNISMEK